MCKDKKKNTAQYTDSFFHFRPVCFFFAVTAAAAAGDVVVVVIFRLYFPHVHIFAHLCQVQYFVIIDFDYAALNRLNLYDVRE